VNAIVVELVVFNDDQTSHGREDCYIVQRCMDVGALLLLVVQGSMHQQGSEDTFVEISAHLFALIRRLKDKNGLNEQ
jgi:hypothetical protein